MSNNIDYSHKVSCKKIISPNKIIELEFIFNQLALKLYTNLTNTTGDIILLDRLENPIKIYVLRIILDEIKTLVINITYYSSKGTSVKYKIDRLLQLLLIRVHKRLYSNISFSSPYFYDQSFEIKWLVKNFEMENGELLRLVFDYFVTSVSMLQKNLCFKRRIITDRLVISILEDSLIKFSIIILYSLILNLRVPTSILIFNKLSDTQLCSLKSQKNNLYWSTYFRTTFFRPKYIYTSLYLLKVINYDGFCNKLVYLPILRISEERTLTNLQFIVLLYFEVIEFFSPKIMQFFTFFKRFLP
jgi:hypothetical protein